MRRCSLSRFLAPLALTLAAIAVLVIVRSQDTSPPGPSNATSAVSATSSSTSRRPAKAPSPDKPSTYTVRSGDTLSSIAEQTGVPVATILGLNRVDAKSLRVGQKLKLRS